MAARGPLVEVQGAAQLRRTLKAAGDDLEDLRKVNADVSRYVSTRASATAPRRSGRLAASGRGSNTKTAAIVRFGGASVPYAGVIHWGWPRHHIAADPFAVNAAHDTEPTWTEYYLREVNRILSTVRGI